jgi:alpha-1,3-rhamnosyltransferase
MFLEKSEKPLVSIVVPCYNHESYVTECIKSILNQDYKEIEFLIIDDGSTDNSVSRIKEMADVCKARFVRFEWRTRENKGLCATLNEAIAWSKGKYLVCIASDDIMLPHKTSRQVLYLEENQGSLGVFGGMEVLKEQTNERTAVIGKAKKYTFHDIFFHRHKLPAPTQMLRLSYIKEIGGFPENLIIEDWAMWLLLTENGGTLDYMEDIFAVYRRHESNQSDKHELMDLERKRVLESFKNKSGYKKAISMADMIYAHDIQGFDKRRSLGLVKKAFLNSPSVLFTKTFLRYSVKFLFLKF